VRQAVSAAVEVCGGAGGCALEEAAAHGEPVLEQVFWQDL